MAENVPYTIVKTLLELAIFRDEMNLRVTALFTALLFWKTFHWLGSARMDHVRCPRHSAWQSKRTAVFRARD